MPNATREVFVNIRPWMQVLFYTMILASQIVLAWTLIRRGRLWFTGQRGSFERDWRIWIRRLAIYAVAQKRVFRKSFGALIHVLIFSGFVVLTIGTTLLFVSHAGPIDFHHGWYYLIYEFVMDTFGVAFCLGCALAIVRRMFLRPDSLGHSRADWYVLVLLLVIGLSGFFVEALRLRFTDVAASEARWSVVGQAIHVALLSQMNNATCQAIHLTIWWMHAVLVAIFFITIPHTRMMHVVAGPLNIALRSSRPVGALAPVAMEDVERTGRVGVGAIEHFTWQQLLSLDSCMECGRCEEACPAWATGKPLSPKALIRDLRGALDMSMVQANATDGGGGTPGHRPLHGGAVLPETLWACTMCQACVQECPVLIGHVDLIGDLRRHLVGEGAISGPPATALRNMGRQANPYGQPSADRLAWAEGLAIPTVTMNPDFEYLFWVGCAGAYDPRAQKTIRATAQLLTEANVNFAVLGTAENCTGDPARRMGDEFLFQELAQANIETLNRYGTKKIVTACPHCLNTLGNEYSQFDGTYEVQHHSQLLAELIRSGRLDAGTGPEEPITIHDPCYLARAHGESEAQRQLVGDVKLRDDDGKDLLREMPRHGKNTFCCGAGGGQMWFEDKADQRISHVRAREALLTGARTVVTACPFCLNMMSDGIASVTEDDVTVLDVTEVLLRNRGNSANESPG